MRTLFFLLLITTSLFSQTVEYGKPLKKGYYTIYQAKDGTTVKVGDVLHINPPNGDHYVFISQNGLHGGPVLANKDVVITKIRVYGLNKARPIVFMQFKGYGMIPLYIDYENAIEVGEVYNPNGNINKSEALAILKEKKELLDLQLITQAEYDKFKKDLAPIIMNQ